MTNGQSTRPLRPYATGISWDEAVAFCDWLSRKEHKQYRLPAEAERECAARAGSTGHFSRRRSVDGPLPDTLFFLAVRRGRYDAILCMYHDQGDVPLKLLDFEGGVNVALGLPTIPTWLDHGTAFDIAWQGIASTRSLVCALDLAARMAEGPATA